MPFSFRFGLVVFGTFNNFFSTSPKVSISSAYEYVESFYAVQLLSFIFITRSYTKLNNLGDNVFLRDTTLLELRKVLLLLAQFELCKTYYVFNKFVYFRGTSERLKLFLSYSLIKLLWDTKRISRMWCVCVIVHRITK